MLWPGDNWTVTQCLVVWGRSIDGTLQDAPLWCTGGPMLCGTVAPYG